MVRYRTVTVDGHRVFYRDAGEPTHPTLLLLHWRPPFRPDRWHSVRA